MTTPPEPRFSQFLLHLLVRGDDAEFVHGDIREDFMRMAESRGPSEARRWYRRQVAATVAARLFRRPVSIEAWARDARLAGRRARREPGHTLATVATLALGIGGTATVAALAVTVLRPLPFPEAHELFAVRETRNGDQRSVAPANYLDWRRTTSAFSALAAHDARSTNVTVDGLASRERIAMVSGNFFEVLGVTAREGRTFDPTFDVAFPEREAVLSHEARVSHFGGGAVIGRTFLVDDLQYEVVGVLPPGVAHPDPGLFAWLRSRSEAPELPGFVGVLTELRDAWYFGVVGRLAPGATAAVARDEMATIAERLTELHPESNTGSGVLVVPLRDETVADFGVVLLALALAVSLILLAAVFNVLHLALARAEGRRSDTAVRVSLGATGGEIRRGLLVEGWLLGLVGAVAGLFLADRALGLIARRLADAVPRAGELGLSWSAASLALALGLGVGSLIALATLARSGSGRDLRSGLVPRTGGGALIGVQVAASIAILSATSLISVSFDRLGDVDLGFTEEDLITLRVSLPDAPTRSYAERLATYRAAVAEVARLPGVRTSALGSTSPVDMGLRAGVRLDGVPLEGDPPDSGWQPVEAGYFETLGIPILRGRAFGPGDGADGIDVGIVNEAFVDAVLVDGTDLGARVTIGLDGHDRPITIVGIVADTRSRGPAVPPGPVLYRPVDQTVRYGARSMFLAVRSEPGARPPVAAALRRAAPGLPVYDEATGTELVRPFRAPQAMLAVIMVVFAMSALAIGGVGTYGVGMHVVRRRRRDIGVRMALGATRARVTREILDFGMRAALLGVLPGMLLAFLTARSIDSLLFGISAAEPLVPALVALAVLGLTAAAFAAPARRASRVDPALATKDG